MSAERTITDFVRALRSADVSVSTAETLDAVSALRLVGYENKARMKLALKSVLAKSETEKVTYDRLFDLFFSRTLTEREGRSNETEDTADTTEQAANDPLPDPSDGQGEAVLKDLTELAEAGTESEIAVALEMAARAAGVQDIRFSTQVSFYAQKMLKEMGVERLEQNLLTALQAHTSEGDEMAEDLMQARRDMTLRAREYVQKQFDVFGTGATQQFREDFLAEKRINEMDRSDLDRMKPLVQKLAKRLAAKHSRRRKKKNRGQLDVRRTLRSNAGKDGVPFNVHWRQKKKDRPKLVLICDVSGSVARYVRFLLLFLYCMKDTVPDLYTFAFSARLKDVGKHLDTDLGGFENAMQTIMSEAGWGSTDYGQALSDLNVNHWPVFDRRTTVIVLGDGRSNHGDPRIDLFEEIAARSKRIVWLIPEGKSLWGTGDSEMLRYAPHCSVVTQMTTLKNLEKSIDEILMQYA